MAMRLYSDYDASKVHFAAQSFDTFWIESGLNNAIFYHNVFLSTRLSINVFFFLFFVVFLFKIK